MRTETIKPCPFCGSSTIDLTEVYERKTASVFAECLDCGAAGEPFNIGHDMEAITAWNTRADRTCKMMNIVGDDGYSFVCSECGEIVNYFSKKNYCPNCGAKVVE